MAAAIALLAGRGAPVAAQDDTTGIPDRERRLVVYGDDPCPQARDENEVVVCARRPEEERYRIPAPLRRGDRRTETSWNTRAAEIEDAQRDSRPDSCSVVGTFGQTGCRQQMLRQWHAERRAGGAISPHDSSQHSNVPSLNSRK